ncbi:MAG: hypothetical protein HY908_07185 [Myxococcales bacterium]|nr:hypothetical protein [Myxococcales bacterium]
MGAKVMKSSAIALCVGGLALLLGVGCGGEGTAPAGSGSAVKTASGASAKPSASTAATPSASASAEPVAAAEEVDLSKEMQDEGGAGLMSDTEAELGKIDTSKAPALGGGAKAPAAPPDVKWLTVPNSKIQIPNLKAWDKAEKDGWGILSTKDHTAAMFFTTFKDSKDGVAKVNQIAKLAELKDVKWKKSKVVQLGPDKLPARVGGGQGMKDKIKIGLGYAFIETGAPEKVLAILLIAPDKATKETKAEAEAVFTLIKKGG